MLKNVAVVVYDGVEPFALGILNEVWNERYHPEDDAPIFDYALVTPTPGRVTSSGGYDLFVEHGLDRMADADLIAVAAQDSAVPVPEEVCEALRVAYARGAKILAACTSAFTLGAAGLLDGRECTTHWRHAARLREMYPEAKVNADVLYIEDDGVITGAGAAAYIDACLYLVRREFGAKVAATFARRMVVPPHRDGGQAQFVRTRVGATAAETLSPVLAWAAERLDQDLSVETLAGQALMSPRTFARRFRDETGTTPHQWVTQQRLALAEQLLEDTPLSVDEIAQRSGFGNGATLRHHFSAVRGTSPQKYRRTFGCEMALEEAT